MTSIDHTSGLPAYRQIAEHLRTAITNGEYPSGSKLPSERQLAAHYGVTQKTVREAISLLHSEGLVEARHGLGQFVREPTAQRLAYRRFRRENRHAGRAAFHYELDQEGKQGQVDTEVTREPASAEVAGRLGLAEGDDTVVRRRHYWIEGQPAKTSVSHLPASIAGGTAIEQENPGPGGIYARLEELGHHLDHFIEEINSRMPQPEEASFLQTGRGTPVFVLHRTAYDRDGRTVETYQSIMPADRYTLVYDVPAD